MTTEIKLHIDGGFLEEPQVRINYDEQITEVWAVGFKSPRELAERLLWLSEQIVNGIDPRAEAIEIAVKTLVEAGIPEAQARAAAEKSINSFALEEPGSVPYAGHGERYAVDLDKHIPFDPKPRR